MAYVNTTFFPKTNLIKDFATRLAARIAKGRVYKFLDLIFNQASLDLDFAGQKSLTDLVSGNNLVTFTRASNATYVGSDGLIKTATTNTPRFDHDPTTGESLGLLVEEARTNLVPLSIPTSGVSGWNLNSSLTQTLNATTAPDGTQTATKLTSPTAEDAASTARLYNFPVSAGSNIARTVSIFAKAGTTDVLYMRGVNNNVGTPFTVSLTTGQVLTNPGSYPITVTEYDNGWWRISTTSTSTAGMVYVGIHNTIADLYVWGAQLEEGSFPTSYIPTTGAQATRTADVVQITGTNFSSWYNQSEGTVFANAICRGLGAGGTLSFVGNISDDTVNNYIDIFRYQPTARAVINSGGANQATLIHGAVIGAFKRSATTYKSNDATLCVNGAVLPVDTTVSVPTVNRLQLGNDTSNARHLNGHISRLTYWPQRLPDTTLQTITT